MMFKPRRLLPAIILLVVAAVGCSIWYHLRSLSPVEVLEALPDQVDLALDTLHYTHNEDGQRCWTLDADTAEYSRESGVAALEKVSLTIYQQEQQRDIMLTADHGQVEQQQQRVEVWGGVEIVTTQDEHLTTERLQYDGKTRTATTEEAVHLVGTDMELSGVGMHYDLTSGRLHLNKDVRMVLTPKQKDHPENE